jgi:hypothetical protein
MPGERTLYRKIQVVLGYAKDGRHEDKETLVKYITNHKPTNFIYYYRDGNSEEVAHGYSQKSIEDSIDVCYDLKLFSGHTVDLTKTGISACDSRRFPSVVGRRTVEFLESRKIPLSAIDNAIKKILLSNNPEPPTARAIWSQLYESVDNVDFQLFARLLNLLGQSQQLLMTQRRIYLPVIR